MRQLVSLRKIDALEPIPGADRIVKAKVEQWYCVVNKDDFKVGDDCLYFEIDSFLPETEPRFAFIMKAGIKLNNGIRGHRLKTIKLKGQISQGLALPVNQFPELDYTKDLAEQLGVSLYEPYIKISGQENAKSLFPSFLRRSDCERLQNLYSKINKLDAYEITRKMDGSSATYYLKDGEFGLCSRNIELKYNPEDSGKYGYPVKKYGIIERLRAYGKNIALQGELCGPGIQSNPEGLYELAFYVYNIFDIDRFEYLNPLERGVVMQYLNNVQVDNTLRLEHVPIIGYINADKFEVDNNLRLDNMLTSFEETMKFAEGEFKRPDNGKMVLQEGVVFKSMTGAESFKVISNKYLLGEKDE